MLVSFRMFGFKLGSSSAHGPVAAGWRIVDGGMNGFAAFFAWTGAIYRHVHVPQHEVLLPYYNSGGDFTFMSDSVDWIYMLREQWTVQTDSRSGVTMCGGSQYRCGKSCRIDWVYLFWGGHL